MKRNIYLLILFVLVSLSAIGQRADLDRQVEDLFGPEATGIWIRYYKGKVNGLNDVLLALGHDGEQYKGFYKYLKSGQTYYLNGQRKGEKFECIEFLENGEQTGLLKGSINDDTLLAERFDNREKYLQTFDLARLKKMDLGLVDCSNGLWLKALEGDVLNDHTRILLQKEPEGLLKGIIQFNDKVSTYDLKGECLDKDCREARLNLFNPIGKSLGSFNMKQLEDEMYEISLNKTSQEKSLYRVELKNTYPLHCSTYQGVEMAYNYIFPVMDDPDFNEWMLAHFKSWLTPLLTAGDSIGWDPEMPDKEMALAWMDVEYLGPKWISGFITFYDPTTTRSKREAFIYHFKKKKNIVWTDLVQDISTTKVNIDHFILQEKEKMKLRESKAAAQWITEEAFDDVCIRKDGFCFSSGFNGIFGERKIIMPYVFIKPYLKSKRFIAKL